MEQWEKPAQSHMRGVLAAGAKTELTGVTGNSDLGIPHDFGSESIWIFLLASDASELFPRA